MNKHKRRTHVTLAHHIAVLIWWLSFLAPSQGVVLLVKQIVDKWSLAMVVLLVGLGLRAALGHFLLAVNLPLGHYHDQANGVYARPPHSTHLCTHTPSFLCNIYLREYYMAI